MSTMAATDFDYLRQLVRERSAIVLEPGKEYLALSRLEPVARDHGLGSIAELVVLLRAERVPGRLADAVVDAMTTNETSWFRDVHPFDSLRTTVLPDVLARKTASRSLSVWSAACSSGQEPYSIAMVLHDYLADLSSWHVRIHATDLSPTMVERTRTGRYSRLEVDRGLPAQLLLRHFEHEGATWLVKEPLRRMVQVEEHNLSDPWKAMGPFDVVFLRNVLIYFDVETKQEILRQVRQVMHPGGWLLLGGSETTLNIDESFERVPVGKTVWYRSTSR